MNEEGKGKQASQQRLLHGLTDETGQTPLLPQLASWEAEDEPATWLFGPGQGWGKGMAPSLSTKDNKPLEKSG